MIREWLRARKRTRFVPYDAIMAASVSRDMYLEVHGSRLVSTTANLIVQGGYNPYRHLTRSHRTLDPGWIPRKKSCQSTSIEKSPENSAERSLSISGSVLMLSHDVIQLQV